MSSIVRRFDIVRIRAKNWAFGVLFLLFCFLLYFSWHYSLRRKAQVQESALLGKWQRIGMPGLSISFLKDGTMSAEVVGERLMSGTFHLVSGDRIVLEFDSSSPKVGIVPSNVSLVGSELRITPPNGETERYKRPELVAPRSPAADLLAVCFTGREPGPAYRAAGFYVTNCGQKAVFLYQVKVQTLTDGSWKTVSEKQPEFSSILDSGSPRLNFSLELEAGERRKIIVKWPEDPPWRVCILYAPEQSGLDAVTAKTRLAWRTRSMSQWRGRVFGSSEFQEVVSKEVKK